MDPVGQDPHHCTVPVANSEAQRGQVSFKASSVSGWRQHLAPAPCEPGPVPTLPALEGGARWERAVHCGPAHPELRLLHRAENLVSHRVL